MIWVIVRGAVGNNDRRCKGSYGGDQLLSKLNRGAQAAIILGPNFQFGPDLCSSLACLAKSTGRKITAIELVVPRIAIG